MNTKLKEEAVRFLSKKSLLHIDMLEAVNSEKAELLYASSKGVLLFHTECDGYFISTEDEATADAMISSVARANLFFAHQKFYVSSIQQKFGLTEKMECYQAAYLKKELLSIPDTPFEIKELNADFLPFILKHYSHDAGELYLRERLNSGNMFGAFLSGQLAGFIGMHAEGTIGLLEVLPEYYRRGIAQVLESFQVNRLLKKGMIPFGQILAGNTPSLMLHKKLNFSISDETIFLLET